MEWRNKPRSEYGNAILAGGDRGPWRQKYQRGANYDDGRHRCSRETTLESLWRGVNAHGGDPFQDSEVVTTLNQDEGFQDNYDSSRREINVVEITGILRRGLTHYNKFD
ncbi:hypothetical protein Dimus_013779 [Dionaea muscipula]